MRVIVLGIIGLYLGGFIGAIIGAVLGIMSYFGDSSESESNDNLHEYRKAHLEEDVRREWEELAQKYEELRQELAKTLQEAAKTEREARVKYKEGYDISDFLRKGGSILDWVILHPEQPDDPDLEFQQALAAAKPKAKPAAYAEGYALLDWVTNTNSGSIHDWVILHPEQPDDSDLEFQQALAAAKPKAKPADIKWQIILTRKLAEASLWVAASQQKNAKTLQESAKTLRKELSDPKIREGYAILTFMEEGGSIDEYIDQHPELIEAAKKQSSASSSTSSPFGANLQKARAARKAAKAASPAGAGANDDDPLADESVADQQAEFFRAQRRAAGK